MATFPPDQLELYLQRIRYADAAAANAVEQHPRLTLLKQSMQDNSLAALTEVQRRHLAAIPWGNSALHYSNHHSISTHPACVFEKLVVRRLDGYCMENTNLLYIVLRSLGYIVYPTGGRVSYAVSTGNPANENYLSL